MGYFYAEDVLTLSCVAKIDNTLKDRVLLELQIKVDDFKSVLSALMGEIHNHQVSNVESASTKHCSPCYALYRALRKACRH